MNGSNSPPSEEAAADPVAAARKGPSATRVVCRALVWLATLGAALVAAHAEEPPATESSAPAAGKPVNFLADIQPIFAAHCLGCHGPEKRSGGLRLDEPALAASGGNSGKPILNGTLESNELYRRVSSSERTYRMPKNADPLSAEEIEHIKRWVEQGTPWSAPAALERKTHRAFYEAWLDRIANLTERYQYEYQYIKPAAFVFLFSQLALLLVARAKAAFNNHRAWSLGKARWFCRRSSQVTGRELGFAWLLTVAAAAGGVMWYHQQKLEVELAKLRLSHPRADKVWSRTIYGFPPVPIRPDHPKQVAGTYYRGNCERNAALFNNGNYLTATLRIQLCDAKRHALEIGDAVPDGGLFVRLEIKRAPGTADALFSKELMDSVFLSETYYGSDTGKAQDRPIGLETLEAGQRWDVYFPIGSPASTSQLVGLIYVYTGRVETGTVRGEAHYGIKYTLAFEGGHLAADSDLWMNSFGNPVVALPEPAGKIPYREWFDFRPIPVITGKNSTDPKLLGVEEYVKKGLIKPEAAAAPSEAPQGEPPATPPRQNEE